MKKNALLLLPVFLFCLLMGSCTKSAVTPAIAADSAFSSTAIQTGTWTITSYTQKTESKTSNFTGMNFSFASDGKVSVTGSTTANGTWTYSPPADGYYGGPASLATFTINIVSGSTFSKLSRAWNVGSQSSTTVQLNHPEPVEDEHVIFTRK